MRIARNIGIVAALRFANLVAVAWGVLLGVSGAALAQQRALGVDISYWNTGNNQSPGSPGISQGNWNTAYANGNRTFAFIRASRGGTSGVDQPAGTPGGGSISTLSRRYDDPRFIQNINRATMAGMLAGPYHYGRLDIVANWPTAGQVANDGTDEANHFIEMAGAWMRPGYLMPMFDLEDGQNEITPGNPNGTPGRSGNDGAQFAIDFSNRIYDVMGIRPAIYTSGTYSNWLQSASVALRNQLAKPSASPPSVVEPAFPMLWNARYAYQGDDNNPGIQTANPKDSASTFYGPWDDYGEAHPWDFWQYSSTSSIPGLNEVDSGVDANVSHGDIEYVRNYLVPAVWRNDSSGDWSALTNWNSGQVPVNPVPGPGQATPFATGPLPTPRLPGAAGSGPTSGQYDTVILERPEANITVTVSTGSHNVRKLYMRESLEISGGSLTVNYDPTYRPDDSSTVRHAGPISAQFSGPVTLGGTGALSVHTLQVDAAETFELNGGNLTFNSINLSLESRNSAKILITGDISLGPLVNAAAGISAGSGSGSSAVVDLGGANRTITVADGTAATDVTIGVPVVNGALTKNGAGTLALTTTNTYQGNTSVLAGKLSISSAFLANDADVLLSTGGVLDLDFVGGPDVIDSLFIDGISQATGTWGATGSGAQFTSDLLAGTGLLQVTTFVPPPLSGDYNEDGVVDAADYVVWRDNLGSETALPNDDTVGVGPDDYDRWKAHFGETNLGGTGSAASSGVPEPHSVCLFAIAYTVLQFAWRLR